MIRGKRWQQPLMRLQRQWGLNLLEWEKQTLAENLEDFEKRMERFNRNGEKLAWFLKQHPSIARVYHGSLDEEAKASKSWLSGYGSIVCFELKSDNLDSLCLFYDHLPHPLLKAPSLGSNRTLVCPYPLLAHYHESPSFFEMHVFSKHMVERGSGKIINVSSGLGVRGARDNYMYACGKGAIIQLTRSLAVSLGRYGITSNCIVPGFFPTDATSDSSMALPSGEFIPVGRTGLSSDLGPVALWLSSSASDYMTGEMVVVDGGGLAGGFAPTGYSLGLGSVS